MLVVNFLFRSKMRQLNQAVTEVSHLIFLHLSCKCLGQVECAAIYQQAYY